VLSLVTGAFGRFEHDRHVRENVATDDPAPCCTGFAADEPDQSRSDARLADSSWDIRPRWPIDVPRGSPQSALFKHIVYRCAR
jgi:hypothetical protein